LYGLSQLKRLLELIQLDCNFLYIIIIT
jgi:hypothetical protein